MKLCLFNLGTGEIIVILFIAIYFSIRSLLNVFRKK